MITEIYTIKSHMTQAFVDGKRVPVTILKLPTQVVSQIKTVDKDGYYSLQLSIDQKNKSPKKSLLTHLKKAKLTKQPKWLREIRLDQEPQLKVGESLPIDKIIAPGDTVSVTGISIGKGFAGVMKRFGFAGGPKTHGQSDRSRAPGSIGRGTTPGRVLPGKKMPGHLGASTAVTKNLTVLAVDLDKNQLSVSGPVPGAKKQLLKLTVTRKGKDTNQSKE